MKRAAPNSIQLTPTNILHGPALNRGPCAMAASSPGSVLCYNWSGPEVYDPASPFTAGAFINAQFVVPTAHQAFDARAFSARVESEGIPKGL
jgi:hypothetical protein